MIITRIAIMAGTTAIAFFNTPCLQLQLQLHLRNPRGD
jgi:hypothetical protein